ncbi:hypothetical protein [Metabacillus fastidiosus]|uniref:hypothetical protein n=1 Tax=Metabacillus fastidiosus TaxID=1458 RepID=UPI002E1DD21B|nr:hypothetical protein [Metabacillus fastidiosus]
MLKLDNETKRRKLPNHIQEGLEPFCKYQIKSMIAVFTFLMLDLLIIMPLLFPVIKLVLYVTLPLMIFVSVWALWLLIRKPEKTEMESLLFLGCLGIVGSFCYFVLAMKYNYMVGITSPFFYIFMFFVYLIINYLFVRNELKKYSSLERKPRKKTPAWHYTMATIAPAAGYISIQYIMDIFSSLIVLSFMSIVFWGLSATYSFLLARAFHKYFFIKKNIHLVVFADKQLNQKYKIKKEGFKFEQGTSK